MTRVGASRSYVSTGLKYLSIVVSVASIVRILVHFSQITLSGWAEAFLQLYRESVYPIYRYTIEWVISFFGISLTDFHRDILTLYVIGCGAQVRYLSYLETLLDPKTAMGVNIPMIVYRGKFAKAMYVLLWPFVITLGHAMRFIRRRFYSYLMRRYETKRGMPLFYDSMAVFDDMFSSRYEATGFARGLAQVILVATLFLILNAVSVNLTQ